MRYAIYFMPPAASRLWQFGSAVLGYDAATGKETAFPAEFASLPMTQWTAEPRRYGFHATLKAPFALCAGAAGRDLLERAREFAAKRSRFEEPALELAQHGNYVALALARPSAAVAHLADAAVEAFDDLRQPLSEEDRIRRKAHLLTPRQRQYLERWGYPFVFEEFAFHMTLSGNLADAPRQLYFEALEARYAAIAAPQIFDAIAVFCQPTPDARFTLLERIAFRQ